MEKDILKTRYEIINTPYIKTKDIMILLSVNRTYAYKLVKDFRIKSKKALPFNNFIPTAEFLKYIKFDIDYILKNYKKMNEKGG